jgi:signal transduction histidine kinase
MKTHSPELSKLADWFKKRTEGQRIMQWISYVMIFLMLVVFIVQYPAGLPGWRFNLGVLALAMLLVINILWDQSHDHRMAARYWKVYLWAFVIAGNLLVLGSIALTGRGEMIFLLFMQIAQFAVFFGVWPNGVIFSAINLATMMGILVAYGASSDSLVQAGSQFLAGMVFIQIFVFLVDRSARETRRAESLLKDLQAANAELKAAQQKEKELAIAEERVRLARDIHDGLGHHLTVLSIQLQAADKLVERNPQAAAEAIRTCRAEAQAALEEVRRSVGVMRQTPAESQPLKEMIAGLVHDFGEHADLQAQFEQSGDPIELSSFAQQTLYRTVQESLTNVQKHGEGVKQIVVRLEYTSEVVHLAISNDGQKPDAASAGQAGYGLKGLRERVDQLGGNFCCGPGSLSGFQVDVSIPLQEVIRDQSSSGG